MFFVLKKLSKAQLEGDPVYGIVRAFASGHSGATRTLITPSPQAQAELSKRVLRLSNLNPADVSLLEGTSYLFIYVCASLILRKLTELERLLEMPWRRKEFDQCTVLEREIH